jgi:hypothetical protein
MQYPLFLTVKAIAYVIFSGVALSLMAGGFWVTRLLHISVQWVTWAVAGIFILISGLTALFLFWPESPTLGNLGQFAALVDRNNNALGNFAVALSFCAFGQWTTLRGYQLIIKQRFWAYLVSQMRQFLTFVRKYHQLFGWLVIATATGHALSYIYRLEKIEAKTLIAGLIGWLLLAGLAGLGLWMDNLSGKKLPTKNLRLIHFGTALLFFVVLLIHS